ncbi:PR domain zinc finger protein 1 like protein [Argiope bruennichi]|uniref:PR domain zinc finger protein 1 like protein n=1 Tax=Argiope bruennichi TaxID=94029 RepID=A0A8T0F620_ARGBR|nr:PR domain zinc finger protein 1 like protein [Argiope bruennichi]
MAFHSKSGTSSVQLIVEENKQFQFRMFTCSVCHKKFSQKANLLVHFRVHTGERPFKCTICNKGFSTKQNMLKHFTTHDVLG